MGKSMTTTTHEPPSSTGYVLTLLVVLLLWGAMSHQDYLDEQRADCAAKQKDYDSARDACVEYPNR